MTGSVIHQAARRAQRHAAPGLYQADQQTPDDLTHVEAARSVGIEQTAGQCVDEHRCCRHSQVASTYDKRHGSARYIGRRAKCVSGKDLSDRLNQNPARSPDETYTDIAPCIA
ncbi:hypothetical protein SDC9_169677 [bioreactor metagenome]|uniref:Uncharacterized protein n=1 Tax=bioreactor metagenome TaxID=1076179 RepID=A0A645GE59_9ZZZZ